MPRLISFMLTTEKVRDGSKTVTRRMGWLHARPGQILQAIEQGQGLKKGEKVKRIRLIRVLSVTREPLNWITPTEVRREGFPEMTPAAFVAFFCTHNRCSPFATVTRIEFDYPDEPGAPPPALPRGSQAKGKPPRRRPGRSGQP